MQFNVTQQRSLWWGISGVLLFASIAVMAYSVITLQSPVRPGLDFIGGTRLQLERACQNEQACSDDLSTDAVRQVLQAAGLEKSSIQIIRQQEESQTSLEGILIRTQALDIDAREQLQATLTETFGEFDADKTQIDIVGPVIGQQLLTSGLVALIVAFAGIILYLSIRFQLDYAVFSIIALFHDVLITAGIFSGLGLIFGLEANSLFIVALLTITGFSVNDTVVIYDRIRETLKFELKQGNQLLFNQVVDEAVNQTLGRSINTTLTTTLPLIAIFLFGGETLKNFALTLIIGFILGAYSSIFVASTLLGLWRERTGQAQIGTLAADISTDSERAES